MLEPVHPGCCPYQRRLTYKPVIMPEGPHATVHERMEGGDGPFAMEGYHPYIKGKEVNNGEEITIIGNSTNVLSSSKNLARTRRQCYHMESVCIL
ncbi:uncharacterized protein LOC144319139 isoform X2 [Canis aureus]